MSSIGIDVNARQLRAVSEAMDALRKVIGSDRLTKGIGGVVKSQTAHRIQDTKRDPFGARWAQWSPSYAKTREAQHSLLISSGRLVKSITYERIGERTVRVGTRMRYARYLQEGTREMPARGFMGLSQDDKIELEETIYDVLMRSMKSIRRR